MSLASRITSLLTSLTPGQVDALAPAERQQLANECQRVLRLAQAGPVAFKAGAGEHAQAGTAPAGSERP